MVAPGLPRYSVALVQSELEMLNTPGNELSSFLLARRDLWRTEVFTERTFEAALGSADRFDCVILGFNAVYQSEAIQDALKDWTAVTGLVVLHQLKQPGVSFLPRDLTVTLNTLGEELQIREAVVHRHTRPEDEILLNWPEPVGPSQAELGRVTSAVMCHLETLEVGAWRTSLELPADGRRLPVLLRTSSLRRPRVIVCTLQLEPRKDAHAALLRNMITYCAGGWPEIAIVADEQAQAGADLARKLRVQGANTVELPLRAPDSLRFDAWPLRRVHEVVSDEAWPPETILAAPGAREWLEAGNTLVRVGRGGLTFHHGASDAHLVAERWATWFHGSEHALWHGGTTRRGEDAPGSIFGTRAVLRVLELLRRDETRAQPERLGLEPPESFAERVVALLRRRKEVKPSFEATISTYAAALDVVTLLGGPDVAPELAEYIEDWLRSAFADAAHEDRFDIVRALGDEGLLLRALDDLPPGPLPAVLATRLREAAVVCGVRPALDARRLRELPSSDVDSNLLLASEYVAARVAFSQKFRRHPGGRLDDDGVTRALTAIGKFGALAGPRPDAGALAQVRPGVISTEARALIRYYDAHPTSSHAMLRRVEGVPGTMVEAVLKASNDARAGEAAAHREVASVRAELGRRDRTLRHARHVLGLVTAGVAVALFAWFVAALGTSLGGIVSAFGLAALLFVVLSLGLHRFGLAPAWARRLAQTVSGGFWGVAGALAGLFQDDDERRR